MNCEKCRIEMQKRSGRYGDFFFCPNSRICGQKTITAIDNSNINSSFRTQAVSSYQKRQSRLSKSDRDAEFYVKGEQMMEDIEFGELGGCCD
jgi:ssDNA-binding Zn-finger/Zn-ribbon topoisomerase 1